VKINPRVQTIQPKPALHPIPHANRWRRALSQHGGAARADRVIARAQTLFDDLFEGRVRFANRALRHHLERHILPGLALYRAMVEVCKDREAALTEWDALERDSALGRRRQMALLRFVPMSFGLLRLLARLSMRFSYPASGWETVWVADTPERLAFDIRRCFYLETLTFYGAPELTRHFCALDDWLFEALPTSISWARTKTLGRDDDRCDFCWQLRQPTQQGGRS
jgi:hypothetical protein